MIFILVSCNTILKFLCGGMALLVSFPSPSSASLSKSFRLSFLSGPLSLLLFYHSFYLFLSAFLWPSPTSKSPQRCCLSLLLVISFQGGPWPIQSSKQLDTLQLSKLVTLLGTWRLGITWKFLPASCSSFKFFPLLLLASGFLLFRSGCLTTFRTFAHPARNKVSYAQHPQSFPLHLSSLGLLVLDASLAQELRTPHV